MTATIKIEQFQRRCRYPSRGTLVFKDQVNAMSERLIREGIREAVEQSVRSSDSLIVIRELHFNFQFDPTLADNDLLHLWKRQLDDAVADALRQTDCISFISPVHAWLDVAHALCSGNFQRRWAWHRLGLIARADCSATEVRQHLWATLLEQPSIGVLLVGELARQRRLAEFLWRGEPGFDNLRALAKQIIERSGHHLEQLRADVDQVDEVLPLSARDIWAIPVARRIVAHSSLLLELLAANIAPDPANSIEYVLLLIAESEPALLHLSATNLALLTAMLMAEIQTPTRPRKMQTAATRSSQTAPRELSRQHSQGETLHPGRALPPSAHGDGDRDGDAQSPSESDSSLARATAAKVRQATDTKDVLQIDGEFLSQAHQSLAVRDSTLPDNTPNTWYSEFAGLLYLLNGLERERTVAQLVEDPCLRPRSVLWVLEQLALILVPAAIEDPALAIFCGRTPGDPTWWVSEAKPNEEECQRLNQIADQLFSRCRQWLQHETQDRGLFFHNLCRRRARVQRSGPWVDVFFCIDELSVEVRRAGLDLDPGHLAWLALIVKFHYE